MILQLWYTESTTKKDVLAVLFSLIPVLLLTFAGLSLSICLKRSFAHMMAPIVFSVMLILYGAYLTGFLAVGRIAVILLCLLSAISAVFSIRRKQLALTDIVTRPEVLLYGLAIVIFYLHWESMFFYGTVFASGVPIQEHFILPSLCSLDRNL